MNKVIEIKKIGVCETEIYILKEDWMFDHILNGIHSASNDFIEIVDKEDKAILIAKKLIEEIKFYER